MQGVVSYRMAQAFCNICRFGELRVAHRVFDSCGDTHLLKRQFFDGTLVADVSRSVAQQLLYLTGERAVPERYLVRRFLRPGMSVVDVGANIGYYLAMFESVVGPTGHVTCVEPSPANLPELKANIHENGWTNVTLHACAVGSHVARVGLLDGVNSGVVAVSDGVFESIVCPLDDLVAGRCDFLKVDVDGYEWQVLQGSRKMIERDKPILFLEYHPELVGRHGGSLSVILDFLQSVYSNLQFFDVPNFQSVAEKVKTRYFGADPVRRIDIAGVPEERLHEGRLHGTLWILASDQT